MGDLDALADRFDKLANRRASYVAAKDMAEIVTSISTSTGEDAPVSTTNKSILLEIALTHVRIRQHFREFVRLLYAEENLNFYEAVLALEQCEEAEELEAKSLAICSQFILPGAPTPVNIPSYLSKQIRALGEDDVKLRLVYLDAAKREILHLMQTNFFYKFLATVVERNDPVVHLVPALPPTPQQQQRRPTATTRRLQSNAEQLRTARRKYGKLLLDAVMRSRKAMPVSENRNILANAKPSPRAAATTTTKPRTWIDVHVMLKEREAASLAARADGEEEDDEAVEITVLPVTTALHHKHRSMDSKAPMAQGEGDALQPWTMVITRKDTLTATPPQRSRQSSIHSERVTSLRLDGRLHSESALDGQGKFVENKQVEDARASLRIERLRSISQSDRQACSDYLHRALEKEDTDADAARELQEQIAQLQNFEREAEGQTLELDERDVDALFQAAGVRRRSDDRAKSNAPVYLLVLLLALLVYHLLP